MSLTFAIEPLRICWNEWIALAAEHWKETEGYRHGQPMSPSFDRYNQYDEAGWFSMFTARDEGRMVGYCGMYFVPSMHTQQLLATEDSLFLIPEYRKGRNAINFHKFIEDECRQRNVVEIGMTAKDEAVARLLDYLGYTRIGTQHSKHLNSSADSAKPQLVVVENSNVFTQSSSGS